MPLLGIVADRWGTQAVFVVLGCIPVLALALSSGLREPTPTPEAV